MFLKKTFGIIIFLLIGFISQQNLVQAQQETEEEDDKTENTEQVETEEEVAEEEEEQEAAPTIPAQDKGEIPQDLEKEKDDGGFFSKLKFWDNGNGDDKKEKKRDAKAPDTKNDWHELAKFNYNAEKHQYYRFGFALTNKQWINLFFLRRFEMAKRQYQHYLVIQGAPKKESLPNGMSIITLTKTNINAENDKATALQITNTGLGFEMPKVPSVSREEKKFDEQQALQLAGFKLSNMGFDDFYWLPDKRKDIGGLAKNWNFEIIDDN